ncbi:MAG: LysE family translocator [Methermicoccaceae archaeon]
MNVIEALVVGFTVGLTGAMAPGPMLIATIEHSIKEGWRAGPKVVMGHATLEVGIFILIVYGVYSLVQQWVSEIGLFGGVVMCLFGLLTIKSAFGMFSIRGSVFKSPYIAGVITSASNPYFWIWWLTVGLALIMLGLPSILAALTFMVGHLLADFSWYAAVALTFSRTRQFISDRVYRGVLGACGVFLLCFGFWFIYSSGQLL